MKGNCVMTNKIRKDYVKKMHKLTIIVCILVLGLGVCACTRRGETLIMLTASEEDAGLHGETTEAGDTFAEKTEPAAPAERQETITEVEMVCVHVGGAVNDPGVYELPKGSRIYEAIEAAGNFTEDAATDYTNLAQIINDEMMIIIPTGQDVENGDIPMQSEPDNGLVNINTADITVLCTLPGVGESRAEAIIAYRERNGSFEAIEQIMEVDGIKEAMYAKLQDKICVR